MAVKKAYYYKMNLISKVNGQIIENNYKNNLDYVLNRHLNDRGNYKSITLKKGEMSNGKIIDRVILDVIRNDQQYLFARVSKSKDDKENLIRNERTNEILEVLQPNELEYKTLEAYTYFLLDYTQGILSYIEGRQAAKIKYITNLFDENDQYNIDIENIASNETIRALLTEGSTISRIYYDFRVPNPEILKELKLPPRVIDILSDTAVTNARIILKNEPRKNILEEINIIKKLINALKPLNEDEPKAVVVGKTPNTTQQEFGYEFKNYSTPVDIPATRVEDGQVVVLSLEEISQEYFARMKATYIKSIDIIHNLANI